MEALLRYSLFNISVFILLFQLTIIVACIAAIILIKMIWATRKKKTQSINRELSDLIISSLNSDSEIQIPKRSQAFSNIVDTLENFDQRITDEKWQKIKKSVLSRYINPQLENYFKSRYWLNRQYVARCCLLDPSKENESYMAALLQDPKLVVRVIAGIAITKTNNKELFLNVIRQMGKETPLSRFSYRDAIMQCSSEKFKWLEELLKSEKDPTIQAICLDLLSTRTTRNLFPTILPFLYGDNDELRLLAIKILQQIPGQDTHDVQLHLLLNQNWKVRAETLKGLDMAVIQKGLSKLEMLLKDPNWFVRLQAALVIKKLGGEGLKILSGQNPANEPAAYEISQYVMALPD